MRKNRRLKIAYLIFAVSAIIVVITSTAFAWYVSLFTGAADSNVTSSSAAYFGGGNGSSGNPYVISSPRHLYNLAWLQDLGYFDANKDSDPDTEGIQLYNFIITDSIDMAEFKYDSTNQCPIPPIGIDAHPFIATLNGQNNTIDHLLIDTDFSNASYIKPSSTILADHTETITSGKINCTYLGTFGYLGPMLSETNTKAAKDQNISNFYLDNTTIRSSSTNGTLKSMGIIAGYVNANANTIGVHNSTIDINANAFESSSTVSKYLLVGDYNNDLTGGVNWEEGIAGDQRGEQGYGASTDIAAVFKTLIDNFNNLYTGNKNSASSVALGGSMCFPFANTSTAKIDGGGSEMVNGQTLSYANTQQAASNNLGYICGSTNMAKNDTTKSGQICYNSSKTTIPNTFYWANSDSDQLLPITDSTGEIVHDIPKASMTNFLGEGSSYDTSRLNISHYITLVDINSGDMTQPRNQWKIKNGVVDGVTTDIIVPQNCVWVYAKRDGYFSFICGGDSSKQGFEVDEITRTTPGQLDATISAVNRVENGWFPYITANKYFYYQIPVTAGHEYIIKGTNGYNINIYYIDVGQAGGGGAASYNAQIQGLDFVAYTENGGYTSMNTNNSGVMARIISASTPVSSELKINRQTSEITSVKYELTGNAIFRNIGATDATTGTNVFTSR